MKDTAIRSPTYGTVVDEFGREQFCIIFSGIDLPKEKPIKSDVDFWKYDTPYIGYQLSMS